MTGRGQGGGELGPGDLTKKQCPWYVCGLGVPLHLSQPGADEQ